MAAQFQFKAQLARALAAAEDAGTVQKISMMIDGREFLDFNLSEIHADHFIARRDQVDGPLLVKFDAVSTLVLHTSTT